MAGKSKQQKAEEEGVLAEEREQETPVPPDNDPPTAPTEDPNADDANDGEGGQVGDQGEWVSQDPAKVVGSLGFNPNIPVRTSPPPPQVLPGVPVLAGGINDGVEPQPEYAGPVRVGGDGVEPQPTGFGQSIESDPRH